MLSLGYRVINFREIFTQNFRKIEKMQQFLPTRVTHMLVLYISYM